MFGSSCLFGSKAEKVADDDDSTSNEVDLLIFRWCLTTLPMLLEISVVNATCRTTIGSPKGDIYS